MRCRGANVFISTWPASTLVSSSSSKANRGTCLRTSGLQGIPDDFTAMPVIEADPTLYTGVRYAHETCASVLDFRMPRRLGTGGAPRARGRSCPLQRRQGLPGENGGE